MVADEGEGGGAWHKQQARAERWKRAQWRGPRRKKASEAEAKAEAEAAGGRTCWPPFRKLDYGVCMDCAGRRDRIVLRRAQAGYPRGEVGVWAAVVVVVVVVVVAVQERVQASPCVPLSATAMASLPGCVLRAQHLLCTASTVYTYSVYSICGRAADTARWETGRLGDWASSSRPGSGAVRVS